MRVFKVRIPKIAFRIRVINLTVSAYLFEDHAHQHCNILKIIAHHHEKIDRVILGETSMTTIR